MSWGDALWGEFEALPVTFSGTIRNSASFLDFGPSLIGVVCQTQDQIDIDVFNIETGLKENTYSYNAALAGASFMTEISQLGRNYLHWVFYWNTGGTTRQIEYVQFDIANKIFLKEVLYQGEPHYKNVSGASGLSSESIYSKITETEAEQPAISWLTTARSMGSDVINVGINTRTGPNAWTAVTQVQSGSGSYSPNTANCIMPSTPGGASEIQMRWSSDFSWMLDTTLSPNHSTDQPVFLSGGVGGPIQFYNANITSPGTYYINRIITQAPTLYKLNSGSRIYSTLTYPTISPQGRFAGLWVNGLINPSEGYAFGFDSNLDLYIYDLSEQSPGSGLLRPDDSLTLLKIGAPYNTAETDYALNAKNCADIVLISGEKWITWITDDGAGQDYICRVNIEEFTDSRGAGHLITGGVTAPLPAVSGSVYQGIPITRLNISGGVSPPLPVVLGAVVTSPAGLMPAFNYPAEYLRYYCSADGESFPLTAIIIRVTKKPDDISISRKIELHFPSSQTLYNQISSNSGAEYKVEADRVVSGAQERIEIASGIMSSRWLGTSRAPIVGEFETVYFKQSTKDINPDAAIVWGTNSARFPMDLAIEPGDTLFNRRTIKSVTHYFYAQQPALTEVFF